MEKKKILIIDDDSYTVNKLNSLLEKNGYAVQSSHKGKNGIKLFNSESYDLVLCDFRLPDSDGNAILKLIKSSKPDIPVIIITDLADIRLAVRMIKAGAYDFITKPVLPDLLLKVIKKALAQLQETAPQDTYMDTFITGSSKSILEVMEQIKIIAPTELTILIEGETGSGKEYLARMIHNQSGRRDMPFIAVDCGAMPKYLANSEMFGHVKGAFTNAISDKKGFFEVGDGGTIFLDEVGNLPYENQAKLLRALQERVISRVGENKTKKIDVRLIAATNENLTDLVAGNEFREDLFHRLNEFKLSVPPLRERMDDLREFIDVFVRRANDQFDKSVSGIDAEVEVILKNYQWYGNIRELENVINRAVLLTGKGRINTSVLPGDIINNDNEYLKDKLSGGRSNVSQLKEATEITEKEKISQALINSDFNKTKAAKILNIDRKTLYNKIKQYGIDRQNG
ncbi:MAG TPA: sigma-54 dependent transcriptional regulator [Bacteroidales bacterium]|nr:sigma-54 dependent transcriptional regulator [Bacteroidales bacterium]